MLVDELLVRSGFGPASPWRDSDLGVVGGVEVGVALLELLHNRRLLGRILAVEDIGNVTEAEMRLRDEWKADSGTAANMN